MGSIGNSTFKALVRNLMLNSLKEQLVGCPSEAAPRLENPAASQDFAGQTMADGVWLRMSAAGRMFCLDAAERLYSNERATLRLAVYGGNDRLELWRKPDIQRPLALRRSLAARWASG